MMLCGEIVRVTICLFCIHYSNNIDPFVFVYLVYCPFLYSFDKLSVHLINHLSI